MGGLRSLRAGLALALLALAGSCGGGGGSGAGGGGGVVVTPPAGPTITAITGSDGKLVVAFAPAAGSTSASYTVTCASGSDSRSASAAASPIEIGGLDNGVPWSCTVRGASGSASAAMAGTPNPPLAVAPALPVLAISTDDGQEITSTEIYVPAHYRLTDTDGTVLAESTTEVRGRGHSTWTYPKKPYRLKLTTSTALLGMPANRHWVLLANYLDKTLIRTELAFDLAERLGFAWTPRSRPVVVEFNGDYRGIYQLVEHIRIGSNRVNIPELKVTDTAPAAISGGYLIEIDARKGEDYCPQSTRSSVVFCFANPETLLQPGWEPHKAWIDQYLADTEAALYGAAFADPALGYAAWIDVPSAIDWYLLNELFKNIDSNFYSSVFLYKPRGGKLTFGPVWDFDLSAGNVDDGNGGQSTGWRTRQAAWFARMFEDPAFAARVRTRWKQLRGDGTINALFAAMDRRAAFYRTVQERNFQRWDILNARFRDTRPVIGPYDFQVSEMKNWLIARRDWMDTQFN